MIRVVRLLEYEFPSNEVAQDNLEKFTVPQNGSVKFGNTTIRSAIIVDLNPGEGDADTRGIAHEVLDRIQKLEEQNHSREAFNLVGSLNDHAIREALTIAWHQDKNYAMAASVLAYEQGSRS